MLYKYNIKVYILTFVLSALSTMRWTSLTPVSKHLNNNIIKSTVKKCDPSKSIISIPFLINNTSKSLYNTSIPIENYKNSKDFPSIISRQVKMTFCPGVAEKRASHCHDFSLSAKKSTWTNLRYANDNLIVIYFCLYDLQYM